MVEAGTRNSDRWVLPKVINQKQGTYRVSSVVRRKNKTGTTKVGAMSKAKKRRDFRICSGRFLMKRFVSKHRKAFCARKPGK